MKLFKTFFLFASLAVVAAFASCSSDDDDDNTNSGNQSAVTITGKASDIEATYATLTGYAYADKIPSTAKNVGLGIQVSQSQNMDAPLGSVGQRAYLKPLTPGVKSDDNTLSLVFSGLAPGKTYYYRSFVFYNGSEYYYGEVKSFQTKSMVGAVTNSSMADVQANSAIFSLTVNPSNFPDFDKDDADVDDARVGVFYSKNQAHLASLDAIIANAEQGDNDVYYKYDEVSYSDKTDRQEINEHFRNPLRISISLLDANSTYYYRTFTAVNGTVILDDIANFTTLK